MNINFILNEINLKNAWANRKFPIWTLQRLDAIYEINSPTRTLKCNLSRIRACSCPFVEFVTLTRFPQRGILRGAETHASPDAKKRYISCTTALLRGRILRPDFEKKRFKAPVNVLLFLFTSSACVRACLCVCLRAALTEKVFGKEKKERWPKASESALLSGCCVILLIKLLWCE